MKHHRVQMAPVAISATFCVRDRLSAGRAKSEMPVSTSAHCAEVSAKGVYYIVPLLEPNRSARPINSVFEGEVLRSGSYLTFMIGALDRDSLAMVGTRASWG